MTDLATVLAAYEAVTGWSQAQVLHYANCVVCDPLPHLIEVGSCGCASDGYYCDEYHERIPWADRDQAQVDVAHRWRPPVIDA